MMTFIHIFIHNFFTNGINLWKKVDSCTKINNKCKNYKVFTIKWSTQVKFMLKVKVFFFHFFRRMFSRLHISYWKKKYLWFFLTWLDFINLSFIEFKIFHKLILSSKNIQNNSFTWVLTVESFIKSVQ